MAKGDRFVIYCESFVGSNPTFSFIVRTYCGPESQFISQVGYNNLKKRTRLWQMIIYLTWETESQLYQENK